MTELELSRRERKKEETRERIFKAACKLFRDKGFEETTIDEIAEKADVAKGTFFNYFPRKESVLGYLSEIWIDEAEKKAAEIFNQKGSAAASIRDMFVEFAGFYEDDPQLAQYIVAESTRRFTDGCDDICMRWDDLGVRLIQHLQSTGEVRRDVTPERAHEILGAVYHDTLMRWASAETKPFALKEELRSRLTITLEGLDTRRNGGKSMFKTIVAAIAAVTLATVPAAAQNKTPEPVSLTLQQAVDRALTQGEEMRSARARYQDTQGQVREALSGALPQVNGSVTYARQFASIYQSLGSGAGSDSGVTNLFKNSPFGAPNSWNFSVTASQLLFSAGKVGAGLKAARFARTGADAQQQEAAGDIIYRVKRAYLQAQYRQRAVEVATAGLQEARQQLRQVQLFQKAGTRAEYDLLRAEVDAANQEPIVVQAQGDLDIAMVEFRRLVNVPPDQPLTLATPLASGDGTIPAVAETDMAESPNRPALAVADATVQVRQQLLRATKADRWPSVTVQTTFSEQAFPSQVFGFGTGFRRNWDAQVKVSVPLFNGFRTEAQVDRAAASLEEAVAQRNTVKEQVDLDVAQARAEIQRTQALLTARKETVRQARRAQHLASVRYANGLSTQLEVSDARLLAQRSEMNEAQSTLDYLVAMAQLERALGRPLSLVKKPLEQAADGSVRTRVGLTTSTQDDQQ